LPNPTNIFAWSGTGNNNCTLSGDTTITRQYSSIPLKMVMTGTDPYVGSYNSSIWNLAPAASGQTWTLSFYAKGSETLTGNCYIFGANSSGNYIEAFATSFTVTNTWQRFSLTSTFSNASTAFIQMRFGGSSGQVGKTIWWDGVQLERASAATNFNPYYFGNAVWKDVSGNNYNGTLTNGPTFSNTNKGAIVFDGVDDYIDLNSNNIITGINPFTFEAFYKLSGAGNAELFGNYGSGYTTNYIWISGRYGLFINGGYPYFQGYPLSTGTYHMAVTRDSAGACSLYKNGVLDGTATNTVSIPVGLNFRIGCDVNGLGELLNGEIYSMRVYNRTLSATEIFNNYQATKTRFGL
jgi:hypothetical protein